MLFNEKSSLDSDLHAALIDSSVKLLELVSEVFKPCPTPGRQHYLFNMKTIITILQNLRMLSDTQRTDNLFIISLWRHEVFSTIGNQLPRHADSCWLECTLNDLIKQKFSSYTNSQDLLDNFVNFRIENRNFERPMSSFNNRSSKTNLSTFESLDKVRSYLEQVYNRYKEEFGYYQINIFLSENAAYHIIRIYRILTFTQG
ncbi:dynein gamma flagellar outer arm-like [Brachionus plicatilis]|uniref:Dynein gamma flagellar outer arm-like n=1 Tax=Brachionus plicatilis TaxID=10195 RepID=A0A3M7PLC8_BRAPC|nr:dynein gamma flagellar outer arm-like [Brachionus plicatilis]